MKKKNKPIWCIKLPCSFSAFLVKQNYPEWVCACATHTESPEEMQVGCLGPGHSATELPTQLGKFLKISQLDRQLKYFPLIFFLSGSVKNIFFPIASYRPKRFAHWRVRSSGNRHVETIVCSLNLNSKRDIL